MLLAAASLAALTSCGGTTSSARSRQADRIWAANVAGVVDLLERDLALSQETGTTVADARRALANASGLYTDVVAYTDFGGCRRMVANAGTPGAGGAGVVATLDGACASLQRAAALFTQATASSDAGALVDAGRTAAQAAPLLARAAAALQAASARRSS